MAYDDPSLAWFKDVEGLGAMPGARGGQLVSWTDRPLLTEALGYIVQLRAAASTAALAGAGSQRGAIEPANYVGKIVGCNAVRQTVRVLFQPTDTGAGAAAGAGGEDCEDVPYASPDLAWMLPPLGARSLLPRPPLVEAVGYGVHVDTGAWVDVDVAAGAAIGAGGASDAYQGVVVAVDAVRKTVRVRFDAEQSPRGGAAAPPLAAAVGHHVHVTVEDPDAREFVTYAGRVVSADVRRGAVRVRFDQNSPRSSPRGLRYSPRYSPRGPLPLDADVDDVPFDSPDVVWLGYADPVRAVGHIVHVHATVDGATVAYAGRVVGANTAAGTVQVLFDADGSASPRVGDAADVEVRGHCVHHCTPSFASASVMTSLPLGHSFPLFRCTRTRRPR